MPRCRVPDCTVRHAIYGLPNQKPECCSKHKESGMKDVVHPFCLHEGCEKRPHYNFEGETDALFCTIHKAELMVNIKNKTCAHENCKKQPTFNFEGEKKGLYCADHLKTGMVDIKHRRCIHEGCTKRAFYNHPGESKALYCSTHREKEMLNVVSQKCIHKGCLKFPNYNYENLTTPLYCAEHHLSGMKDIKHKRCMIEGCLKQPAFNYEGETSPLYCGTHSLSGMRDIMSRRCILCPAAVRRDKYKGYCLRCFMYTFPDEPVSRNYKVKEKHVQDFLEQTFPGLFTFDKVIKGGCSNRRPDAYADLLTHALVVECDENQHFPYGQICENKRAMILFVDGGSIPTVFIRFNPDGFIDKDNKKVLSSFVYHKTSGIPMIRNEKEWASRLDTLKKTIEYYINNIPEKEVTVVNLYYDEC
jgi:hypothetical protein